MTWLCNHALNPPVNHRLCPLSCDSQSEKNLSWAVVTHAFHPSSREAEAGGHLSLRPAWCTQRNPVSKKTKKPKKQKSEREHCSDNLSPSGGVREQPSQG